jgi:hypothetical protein
MLTNDSFLFTTQRCPVLFDAEDAENTEIEKIVQALKQELLAGSNASAQSLLYLQNISKRRNARSPYQWILEIY